MELHVALVRQRTASSGIDLYTLSNTGAYGEHGPTTVGLSGHNPSAHGKAEAFRFVSEMSSTRTTCPRALIAATVRPRACLRWSPPSMSWPDKLGIDPFVIRQRNIVMRAM